MYYWFLSLLKHTPDFWLPNFFFFPAKSNDTPEKTPWKEDGEEENLRALAKKFEEKYVSCAPLSAQCVFCPTLRIP